jgi:hypothetical protein
MSGETFKISHPHVVFLYLYSPQSMSYIKKLNANKTFSGTNFNKCEKVSDMAFLIAIPAVWLGTH